MLTGKKLGQAIEAARKEKAVTKAELARVFKVKPPSIQDWVNNGTIEKGKLEALWRYFSDVVGPSHWGLSEFPSSVTSTVSPTTIWPFEDVSFERFQRLSERQKGRLEQALIEALEQIESGESKTVERAA